MEKYFNEATKATNKIIKKIERQALLFEREETLFEQAQKELKEAVTANNTIILKEEVKYIGADSSNLPSYLVSGTYYYTFRVDMNYNFVLISKQYDQKYE